MTTNTTSISQETNSTVRLVAALKVLGVTDDTPLHLRQLLISCILSVARFNDDVDLIEICEASLVRLRTELKDNICESSDSPIH
ncbi:conserved hypothetical protein [Vibrio crassostreae]|nr:conserved hypothetical protein [Vibrio crassostreae]CAK3044948.1 conserved hypothetical protein [Vibrio crassostreae]CAK3585756.1 conserved hypothetical protein [Vibrio crassostreae]CAK3984684.1 conserved hypothetical protein [Vibrio crassostreae]